MPRSSAAFFARCLSELDRHPISHYTSWIKQNFVAGWARCKINSKRGSPNRRAQSLCHRPSVLKAGHVEVGLLLSVSTPLPFLQAQWRSCHREIRIHNVNLTSEIWIGRLPDGIDVELKLTAAVGRETARRNSGRPFPAITETPAR